MVVLLTICTADAQVSLADRVDNFVRTEMQRQKVPGVAIGVVKNGAIVKTQGYGYANLEHQVRVGPDTIFQSGSVGKQFTAAAVMLLVEDGKLSLSDSLTTFFPEAPETWRSITIYHLLTHTSGIPDTDDHGKLDNRKDYTEAELTQLAFGLTLEFPPGARWRYSNTGYVLLGIVIHKVSNTFYGDFLDASVFKPLGMTTARVISEADIIANRAAGYRLENGEVKNQSWVSPSLNTTADGSLYLSVRDVLAWDAAIRARTLLKPDDWVVVFKPAALKSGKTYPYGFGWFLDERGGEPLHHHRGSWQGFKAQFSRFIGEDLSVVVLANLAEADPVRFADGIAEIINPKLARPPLSAITDREPQVTSMVSRLLDQARAGALAPRDFVQMQTNFFSGGAKMIQEQLRRLGQSQSMILVQRTTKGDDRIFVYELTFSSQTLYCTVGIDADGRVSQFQLREG
jgi:CubicO group peptidase (beta-lactamase class C family)